MVHDGLIAMVAILNNRGSHCFNIGCYSGNTTPLKWPYISHEICYHR